MTELWIDYGIALLVSGVLVGVFYGAIRAGARNWMLLLLGVAPVVFVYLWSPNIRVYSYHGFMHLSVVYEILQGGVPPGNPIFAGEPLLYPWGHPLLAAGLSRTTDISPATAFALINVVALALTLVLVFKTARLIFADRTSGVFAATLSVFGVALLLQGPLAEMARELLPSFRILPRGIPLVAKFFNVNANPVGILMFAWFLYSALSIFTSPVRRRRDYVALTVSVAGAGFFYPVALLAVIPSGVAISLVWYLREGNRALGVIAMVAGCVAAGTLAVVPYLYGVVSGKSEAATMRIASDWSRVAEKTAGMLLVVSFAVALMAVKRTALRGLPRPATNGLLAVGAVAVTTALMYVFCFPPLDNEYKFMALSCLALGVLAGGSMRAVFRNQPALAGMLHVLLLLPFSAMFMSHARADWEVSDPFYEEGLYLRHADAAEDALYRWISTETHPSAVFVDSRLTIPVFGRRALYVGLPDPRQTPPDREARNGWEMLPRAILQWVSGFSPQDIATRQRVAAALCRDPGEIVTDEDFARLITRAGTDEVYVVSRDGATDRRLSADRRLRQVFQEQRTTVYRVVGASDYGLAMDHQPTGEVDEAAEQPVHHVTRGGKDRQATQSDISRHPITE